MSLPRAFLSFDFDHDALYRMNPPGESGDFLV